jgi:hypothetical protein
MGCCRERTVRSIELRLQRAGLTAQARALREVEAEPWGRLPKGWTQESLRKMWKSLTGDRKHKVTACAKKMAGKVSDPWAFCASLVRKVKDT